MHPLLQRSVECSSKHHKFYILVDVRNCVKFGTMYEESFERLRLNFLKVSDFIRAFLKIPAYIIINYIF